MDLDRQDLVLALAGAMDETASKAREHAEAMRGLAVGLNQEAARLEEQATKLLKGAEAMGAASGESSSETAEAVDLGTTINSRGESVNFELVRDTARRLGRFTRPDFERELALKPVIVSRWIARLREREMLEAIEDDDGVHYEWANAPVGEDPTERPRSESPEAVAHGIERGREVKGTGSGKLSNHSETKKLIAEVERQGGSVQSKGSGHITVVGPSGATTIAKTPGSSDLRKTRANVRKKTGLRV